MRKVLIAKAKMKLDSVVCHLKVIFTAPTPSVSLGVGQTWCFWPPWVAYWSLYIHVDESCIQFQDLVQFSEIWETTIPSSSILWPNGWHILLKTVVHFTIISIPLILHEVSSFHVKFVQHGLIYFHENLFTLTYFVSSHFLQNLCLI